MTIKPRRSPYIAYSVLILFLFMIVNTSYARGMQTQEDRAQAFFKEGVDAFKNGDYTQALEKFNQVLALSSNKKLLTDTYLYLSLLKYYLGELESSKEWIKKLLQNDPDVEISSTYPAEYIDLFNQVKSEESSKVAEETPEELEEQSDVPEAVYKEMKKGKGKSKTLLYVLGAVAVVGGAFALYWFVLRSKVGEISVTSSPSGADIYLNGSSTGKKTNATLTDIEPGTYTIKLALDGYQDWEGSVTVQTGKTANVSANLTAHTLQIIEPNASTKWVKNSDINIRWSSDAVFNTNGNFFIKKQINQFLETSSNMSHVSRMRILRANAFRSSKRNERQTDNTERSNRKIRIKNMEGFQNPADKSTAKDNPGILEENTDRDTESKKSTGRLNSHVYRDPVWMNNQKKNQALGNISIQGITNVKIELFKDANPVAVIAESTANSAGSYPWTVPQSLELGSDYKVRISVVAAPSVFVDSQAFEVVKPGGSIKITSSPSGAKIYLDGTDTGKTTNTTLQDIPVGNHTIRLELDRYQDWIDNDVEVVQGETTTVNATLTVGNFTEDFDDNVADYWRRKGGTWKAEDGVYKFTDSNTLSASNVSSYYNLGNYSDFSYEVSCKRIQPTGPGSGLLGIAVRGNNNFSDYYAFVIGPTRLDPNFAIWKIQGGSITKWIQNYTAHPAIYPGTVWNTLKVIAKGNNFEFYCNDNLLWSGPIAGAPSKGKIGLYVWTYSGDDECHYESVSLKLETLTALGLNKAKTGIPSSPKSGDPNKIK